MSTVVAGAAVVVVGGAWCCHLLVFLELYAPALVRAADVVCCEFPCHPVWQPCLGVVANGVGMAMEKLYGGGLCGSCGEGV